jgi:DNA-binding MarR family transcriptional regulator
LPPEPGAGFRAPPASQDHDTAGSPAAVLRQFRVIFRSVKKHFQSIERECGIGGSQLWALATVSETPGIRVSDLARALSIHQSTASNLVEQMVKLELIARERDEVDQRVVRLKANARGVALIARAPKPMIGLLPDALSHLTPAELRQLHASLAGLLDVMEMRDESAVNTPLADL